MDFIKLIAAVGISNPNVSPVSPVLFGTWIFIFVIAFINSLVYIASFRRFSRHLQDHHPDASVVFSQQVGEVMVRPGGKGFQGMFNYLRKRNYKTLNDETLDKYGDRARFQLLLGIGLFSLLPIIFIIIFLTSAIKGQ